MSTDTISIAQLYYRHLTIRNFMDWIIPHLQTDQLTTLHHLIRKSPKVVERHIEVEQGMCHRVQVR